MVKEKFLKSSILILFVFAISISINTHFVFADILSTLDSGGLVGEYTSIAIGSDGNPVISYYDFINEDLKVVHCTDASCSSQDVPVTLDNGDFVGEYTSIAIGSDGYPIVSYFDSNNVDLKVVHCTDASCSTQNSPIILDGADNVGFWSSITIGSDGNPIISYYDFTNGDLKVVHCNDVGCLTHYIPKTIDSDENIGFYSSMAITKKNFPIISYFDGTNDELRIVTQAETCAPTSPEDGLCNRTVT